MALRSPLQSRLKLGCCLHRSWSLSGFPGERETRTSCPKEEPPEGRRKAQGRMCPAVPSRCPLGLQLSLWASVLPVKTAGRWHRHLHAAHGSTVGAMPPYHLSPLSACLGEPALDVWPFRYSGHSLEYGCGRSSPRNLGLRDTATLDTHVHSQVLRDTVTYTQVFTMTHARTQKWIDTS